MRGNSYPGPVSKNDPGALRRQIVLPEMNPVEAGCQAKIGSIIHEECPIWPKHPPKFSRMGEHLTGTQILGPVLKDGDTTGRQCFREIANLGGQSLGRNPGREESDVDDGIESGEMKRTVSHELQKDPRLLTPADVGHGGTSFIFPPSTLLSWSESVP